MLKEKKPEMYVVYVHTYSRPVGLKSRTIFLFPPPPRECVCTVGGREVMVVSSSKYCTSG